MRLTYITSLTGALFFLSVSMAQVWTLDKKGFYVNVSYSISDYEMAYDSAGESTTLPVDIKDRTLQLFAQYGLTDKVTLQMKLPYKMLTSEGETSEFITETGIYLETGKLNFFSNIELGAIYKIIDDKPKVSLSLFVESNTADYNYLNGLQTGFKSFGIRPGAGVAWKFDKSWLTYYLGGDIRTHDYSSAIISDIEFGYAPVNYLYAALDLFVKKSIKNGGDCDCTNIYTSLYLNEQEYLAYAIKFGYLFLNGWGFNLGYHSAFIGVNVPSVGIPTIGFHYKK